MVKSCMISRAIIFVRIIFRAANHIQIIAHRRINRHIFHKIDDNCRKRFWKNLDDKRSSNSIAVSISRKRPRFDSKPKQPDVSVARRHRELL